MNQTEFSIIMPVYNEEDNLPLVIEAFEKNPDKSFFEVVFAADEGSSEKTKQIISDFSKKYSFVRYIIAPEKGYGASILAGLKAAKGDFLCWTHADMQADPNNCLKGFELIKQQPNPEKSFVKGNRKGRPLFDKFFEFGMSIFETLILKTKMHDINAQPNIFHKSLLNFITNPPTDSSFDLYVYYVAKTNKYNMTRFTVLFPPRIHGQSAWNYDLKSKSKFIKRTLKFTFKLKKMLKSKSH